MVLAVVYHRNRVAVDEVEVAEDSWSRRMAADLADVDIVKADRVVDQKVSLREGTVAAEAVRIGQQEARRLAEARTESQPGVSCPVLHYAFPFAVPGHDAATAKA